MKKLFLILPIIIAGCYGPGTLGKIPVVCLFTDGACLPLPPETIRNPECLDAQILEVFQVSGDITLV